MSGGVFLVRGKEVARTVVNGSNRHGGRRVYIWTEEGRNGAKV